MDSGFPAKLDKAKTIQTNRPQTNLISLLNLDKGTAGQYNGYFSPATKTCLKYPLNMFDMTAVTDLQLAIFATVQNQQI